ncbi:MULTISPECIES: TetR/AcrR family transcriptional regulator [Burkholderia]|nr:MULTISPECIES: TetR/AcrR family transcriptional regulator [Burkholderia]
MSHRRRRLARIAAAWRRADRSIYNRGDPGSGLSCRQPSGKVTPMSTKRQDIIDTATRLFAEHGYHAVGTDRIIKESGVAKMTLFRNFPTKNDLISEVLTQRAHQALASMTQAVSTRGTPIERLQELFDWHGRWFRARDFAGCMFVGALSEFHSDSGEIIRISVAQKANLRLFVQGLMIDLVEPAAAERVARQIVMLLDGATIAAVAGDRNHAAQDAWEVAKKLIEEHGGAASKPRGARHA